MLKVRKQETSCFKSELLAHLQGASQCQCESRFSLSVASIDFENRLLAYGEMRIVSCLYRAISGLTLLREQGSSSTALTP